MRIPVSKRKSVKREIEPPAVEISLTDPPKKKRARKAVSKSEIELAAKQAEHFISNGMWIALGPRHLVGLYAYMHTLVYKVFPSEICSNYGPACSKAKHLIKELGSSEAVVAFMRWVWKGQQAKENKKFSKEASDFRITWSYQFSDSLVTTWRVQQSRVGRIDGRSKKEDS